MTRRLVASVAAAGAVVGGTGLWLLRPRPVTTARPTVAMSAPPAGTEPPAPRPSVTASPARLPSQPAPPPPAAPPGPPPLRVEADVADASVFVDRRYVGKAPLELRDVTPGSHRVNVSAEGYELHGRDVEVGTQPVLVSVRFKEVLLDESVVVVHKHGFGSCRGRLRASPAGLAFQAEDGKDSFEAPRTGVRISVDYLKKNLRVEVAEGRTYNFTLAGPNADPLLVFQRAATSAWARLP